MGDLAPAPHSCVTRAFVFTVCALPIVSGRTSWGIQLSDLFYSGAEGTVVEGDDLSHKIWGLGADDAPAHTRHHRTLPYTAPQPTLANQSPENKAHTFGDQYQASSHQRRRDTVIDLSQPSTFDHIQDAQQRPRNLANTAAQSLTAKDSNNLPDLAASAMAKLTVLPHVRQQDHRDAPKKTYGAEAAAGDQLGLALQWESLFSCDPQAKAWMNGSKSLGTGQGSSNRLNTSAPPFVPQNYVSQSLLDRAILQENAQYSRTEQTQKCGYRSSDTLATTHTLQDHNAQSPPSTASPLWTPIFTQATDMHHAHGKSFESRTGQHMPDVYSPELVRGAYQSNQLANIHMISQFPNYDLQGLSHGSLSKEKHSPQTSLGDAYSNQDLNQHRGRPPVIDIHQQQSPMLSDTSNPNHGGSNATVTTMDRRRSLTQQHPRSIPLARLIQRRLSSVVEEEVLTAGNYRSDNTSSSSSFSRQLPSGAPVRRLPISPETLRAVHSSSMFGQRSRPKMSNNNAYAGDREFERQPVLGLGGVVPENPSTTVSMMGAGGGGGGNLQQLNVNDDPKAVVKLPQSGPRTDARGIVLNSNRHTAGHAAVAREYAHTKHSSQDTLKQEEKENAKANSESATATTVAGKTSSKKNHNNRHKKRAERASAASSKADRST